MKTNIYKDNSNGLNQATSCRLSKYTLANLKRLCYAGTTVDEILNRILLVLEDFPELVHIIQNWDYDPKDYPKLEELS